MNYPKKYRERTIEYRQAENPAAQDSFLKMTGISNDVTYSMRRDISRKIHRMPMKYFESRTHGEVLSRVTNDVDALQQSLNQSVTQLITSVTTLIGVLFMMLGINVWMTLCALLILPVSMGIIGTVMKHSQKSEVV